MTTYSNHWFRLTHDDRLDAVAGGVGYLIDSMGMDQQKAAAEQKAGEQQELVDAFVEALDGGQSLWNGRSPRVDELGLDDEGWGNIWNMKAWRG